MKPLIFFILTLSISSCNESTEQSKDIDSVIINIAMDSLYFDYQKSILDHQNNIVAQIYDLDKINVAFNSNINSGMCDKDLSFLNGIKGGIEYQKIMCQRATTLKKLIAKYPGIFGDSYDSNVHERILNYFLENSDRFRLERAKSLEIFNQRKNIYEKD